MSRSPASLVMACLLPLLAIPAGACSLAGCQDRIEMHSDFAVKIRHADKPLPGTTVEITGPQGTSGAKKFTVTTDKDGIARITNLAPGDYWLNAEYLDIGAAYDCFHVNERPSRKAKHNLAYAWGDLAPGTRRIAGKLLDSQPGKGGTPIWNLLHRVEVPIVAAKLTLQMPPQELCIARHRMPTGPSASMEFQTARTYCTSTPGRLSLTAIMKRVTT